MHLAPASPRAALESPRGAARGAGRHAVPPARPLG